MKLKNVLMNAKSVFVRRKYKDELFRFVFREPKELLPLYNAMNHTNYTNPDELIVTTMEDVIYMGMKNDLSFLVANELNLYEHQSTLNRNMPLRGLLYIAKMYESYIETHKLNRYQKRLIRLPFPRFVVFYNGEDEMAEEVFLRLSEAFENKTEEPAVECVAKFININYGYNKDLMDRCRRLHDYSYFVACVKKYLWQGLSRHDAVVAATNECIDKGILADILMKNRAEVVDMFLTTFDKKMYEEAVRMDARADVEEEIRAEVEESIRAEVEAKFKAELDELFFLNNELTRKYIEDQKAQARTLKQQGVSYDIARIVITKISEEELAKIYGEK